jgi:hypothetical protein
VTAREKIDTALAYLKTRNVGASTAAPPIWRFCWRLGIYIPPPHFLGFVPIVLLTGTFFGLMMAVGLSIPLLLSAVPRSENTFFVVAVTVGLGALGFGVAMAVWYRWSARQLGLPRWSAFPPDEDCDDTW